MPMLSHTWLEYLILIYSFYPFFLWQEHYFSDASNVSGQSFEEEHEIKKGPMTPPAPEEEEVEGGEEEEEESGDSDSDSDDSDSGNRDRERHS